MASTFRIHQPDVLATLPRPLDQTDGRYHIGEVYSQHPGSKKRKRLEVVVGIDGEAANVYHVPSSGLRTSYPIPPQESFTCAPCSIRYQRSNKRERHSYTYLSTKDSLSRKVTVCKDVVEPSGRTISTSKAHSLQHVSLTTHLFTSFFANSSATSDEKLSACADLLAICKDGHIVCLDGEELEERWSASTYGLCKDMLPPSATNFQVEDAFQTSATEVMEGIFQDRQDAFTPFGQTVDIKTFNPDVITLIATTIDNTVVVRYLIVLGILPRHKGRQYSEQQLVQLHISPLPPLESQPTGRKATYQLHARSGRLVELHNQNLNIYDITGAVPKLQHRLDMPDATSFLQLSEHSVLSLSPTSIMICNPTFQSIQASTSFGLQETINGASYNSSNQMPTLITFLSKLDMAIAVVNNMLVSIQLDRPKAQGKEGLLINSIGRGIPRHIGVSQKSTDDAPGPFSSFIPGSLSESYVRKSLAEVERVDELLQRNDLVQCEAFLAEKFGVVVESQAKQGDQTPDWVWLGTTDRYPGVDRRWILFAISRVFSIEQRDQGNDGIALQCLLPGSNIFIYLIVAGHLTLSNLAAAFRNELIGHDSFSDRLADELTQRLVAVDPTMELLLDWVTSTKLGEVELLIIIRNLLRSLNQQTQLLLPGSDDTGEDEYVAMELDHLERELEVAQYRLGDDFDVRSRALTLAFERLSSYSALATVRALRANFSPAEVLSLIHLLRMQLVGSAWTSRYLDFTSLDEDQQLEPSSDGVIALVAELLARCIDSVGPSGWLINGSTGDQPDAADFLTALKLEVSAALEGLNQAVYLDGIVGETVRFGEAVRDGKAARVKQTWTLDKPMRLDYEGQDASFLPLGLRPPKEHVANTKVVSGGEVIQRTSREKGYLISKQVKGYSLEKIAI